MIDFIFETHLQVTDLDRSIAFYKKLGLTLALHKPERRSAFFYVGERRDLLALKELPNGHKLQPRHFAFGVQLDQLLEASDWLIERGIYPLPGFGRQEAPSEPYVHAWMPAASVYFNDHDGNELEFMAWLDDAPQILDHVPTLSEWNKIKGQQ
ncbi:VOC family protein [Paenibacillus glycanilyticus]|uniref:Fosmidomycin resistance protein n=1 Tax=Paenibacillus glycanilyticus TaxID=126569 RepID=A0ABQ6GKX5_9BACL|nr:VOC family protein [Paenibacillus glycanilyticus]GLX70281.1 fosmidomycin resistance protein [Paenibacillus glycanilyticus]